LWARQQEHDFLAGASEPVDSNKEFANSSPDLDSLLTACKETLEQAASFGATVAAAVLTNDGSIYRGLHLQSKACSHCSVCAEPVALGAALLNGATDLILCVTLKRAANGFEVISPCGTCRELLNELGVRYVAVQGGTGSLHCSPQRSYCLALESHSMRPGSKRHSYESQDEGCMRVNDSAPCRYETNAFRTVAADHLVRPCGGRTSLPFSFSAIFSSDIPFSSIRLILIRQP
jgi:cytidine deaminase